MKTLFRSAVLAAIVLPAAAQIETIRAPSAAEPRQRPNIILIMADDLGYGSPLVQQHLLELADPQVLGAAKVRGFKPARNEDFDDLRKWIGQHDGR